MADPIADAGATYFNDDHRLTDYTAYRHRSNSPNETLERPIFVEMVGDVTGLDILDLGCGDGLYGRELLAAGCNSYTGLESAQRMVDVASQNLQGTPAAIIHSKIEDWSFPVERFDLVVSRLALHYVADLAGTFGNVHQTLKPGGRFVFSVVHPVITASDKSRAGGGKREDWIVDNYFVPGPRSVYFMGDQVEQQHRTVEDLFGTLQRAGFVVEQLRESCPRPEEFADEALFERRQRIPLFLFFAGRKLSIKEIV
ncbi:MAG: methyltransferase domain-containing protein [Caldilineaceae bacterium]|nr:methyltransferase domain-containing protein [Caldilineaceae bacterium]